MSSWIWLVVVWIIGSVLGVGIGRWNGQKALDREYDTGYDEGYADARAEYDARLDRADQIVLQTQELDVPRLPAHAAEKSGSPEAYAQEPGHTIYPELTPQALEHGDAGFQPSGWSATRDELMADDWKAGGDVWLADWQREALEFAAQVDDWLAGQRAVGAGWLTPRMLERAA